jgi:hypothetical protein
VTPSPDIYVIDTSALVDLDGHKIGSNPKTAYMCDDATRETVWKGIEELARLGRIVAVYAQRTEIARHLPHLHKRFNRIDGFYRADTPEVLVRAMQILANAPDWAKELEKREPQNDMADPYIVALAQLEGRIVITSELHRRDRPKKKGARIPDICENYGVVWKPLPWFIQQEALAR